MYGLYKSIQRSTKSTDRLHVGTRVCVGEEAVDCVV